MAENQAEDDFTRKLESHILQTIRSETFRREYMEMTLREHDLLYWGKQEGLEEGASQKAVEAAENFLRMNVLSFEQVSQGTGLPLQQVKEIAERLSVTRKTGNFGLS